MSAAPIVSRDRRSFQYSIYGILIGAACFSAIGGGYGLFLHCNREYREGLVRERLSKPHPDSWRYVASAQAIRYQGFAELVVQRAVIWAACGGLIGAFIGLAVRRRRLGERTIEGDQRTRPLLVEMLVVVAAVGILFALLQPGGGDGLVYYKGKDQFYWLENLVFRRDCDKKEAIDALCILLEGKPFPCRSTIIPAIAECGNDARIAIPVLTRLTADDEEIVKEAAIDALRRLECGSKDPQLPCQNPSR